MKRSRFRGGKGGGGIVKRGPMKTLKKGGKVNVSSSGGIPKKGVTIIRGMGSDPCPYCIIERLVDLILEKRSSTTYIFF